MFKPMKRSISVVLSLTMAACISTAITTNSDKAEAAVTVPPFSSLQNNAKLPDPFLFLNGTRMTQADQWSSRRDEIKALAEAFQYGVKPPKPDSVTGSYSNNNITVTSRVGTKTASFTASITYPSTGTAPYPAIIGIGMSNLNNAELSRLGVAVINLPNNDIADQTNASSRGKGKFYDLYGSNHSAGSIMAWAWGVSRLIDALETTPAARIDATRLGVTGGSRNGKGALAAGAWDERIDLTIPQEPGAGGSSSWRINESLKASGQNVQTASQIVTENTWFTNSFSQFGSQVNKLPFDMHSIAALVAPRALLIIENSDYDWLGPSSAYQNAMTTHMVWEALGIPDRMGFSMVGGHAHLSFPASQQPDVNAYVQKFLVGGGTANTNIMKQDKGYVFDKAKWVDWTVPNFGSTPPTNPPTNPPTDPEPPTNPPTNPPTGGSLVVQYKAGDINATDSQIKPHFNIKNNGTSAVSLSNLKLRYYFSKDGNASMSAWIDWAQIGASNITTTFTDSYVELSFGAGAGSIPAGGQTGDIQLRMAKSDWSNFNEANDYSFDPTKTSYTNWDHVTLYQSGTLVWGVAP